MSLDGLRVLDLSRLLPGAYCAQLLQAQGATVTKVEPKAGDPIRALPGGAAYFAALHQGQQVVTLDLRSPSGRRDFLARVIDADVLVEGFPAIPGLQVADLAGGLQAAFLIAAALTSREKTGRGRRVEVSMMDLMRSWTAMPRAARRAGIPGLPLTGELPCYHVYAVADGFLTVAALEYAFWAEFCQRIDRGELKGRQFDPAAIEAVQTTLGQATRAEWMARFGNSDVCVEPSLTL